MTKKRLMILAGLLSMAAAGSVFAASVPPTYCYVRDVGDIIQGILTGGNTRVLECLY